MLVLILVMRAVFGVIGIFAAFGMCAKFCMLVVVAPTMFVAFASYRKRIAQIELHC